MESWEGDGQMNGRGGGVNFKMDEWMDGKVSGQIAGKVIGLDGWVDQWKR